MEGKTQGCIIEKTNMRVSVSVSASVGDGANTEMIKCVNMNRIHHRAKHTI